MRTTDPTLKKGARLLAVLRAGGTVMAACQAERIHRSTYYAWRAADPAFAARADDAIEAGTDELEEIALKRAITGSDTLLIFLQKARRPEKYREAIRSRAATSPSRSRSHGGSCGRRIEVKQKRCGNAAERDATWKDHPA